MIQTDTILLVAVSVSNFFQKQGRCLYITMKKKPHTVPSITIFSLSYPVITQHQSSHLASNLFQMFAPSFCKCYSH